MRSILPPFQSRSARRLVRSVSAIAGLLAIALQPLPASAAVGDDATDAILGQPNGFSNTINNGGLDADSLALPYYSTFDAAGNLYTADTANHRVLIYMKPMTTDHVADKVVGQPDLNSNAANNGGISASTLNSPTGLAVDSAGNLWVADSGNNRVLEYDSPMTTDTVADRFIGQPNFTSFAANNGGLNASSLSFPMGVAVDSAKNVYVADYVNNRVLEYNNPIATADRVADIVFGQPGFFTGIPDNGGVSDSSLDNPCGVAVDKNDNLWVADMSNSRVLEYDKPTLLGRIADRVLGQPSFAGQAANFGGIAAGSLAGPYGVTTDANGNVYVADTYNHRTLFYTAPIATSDRIADHVYGQPDFNSNTANNGGLGDTTEWYPIGTAVSPTGDVSITEYGNNRTMMFETPVPIVTSLQVKISASGKPKLIVKGHGMLNAFAIVTVDLVPFATFKYKLPATNGTAGTVIATDPSFDALVPVGVPVTIRVSNPGSGLESAPIPFTR
jgi:sugar lactone lactonase YvrE